jgi:hypothetical protein
MEGSLEIAHFVLITGTCFIQKIYAPSSSLLQGKHLPFSPFPDFASVFFMKNPAQTGSGCIRFNDLQIKQATFAEYSCPIRLRGAR